MKSNVDDYVLQSDDAVERAYYSKEAMKNHALLKNALTDLIKEPAQAQVTESKFAQLDKLILEVLKNNS